jgi:hypothetical protein
MRFSIGARASGLSPSSAGLSLGRLTAVSWLIVALLACAVAVLIAAEWPRLEGRLGVEARRNRERQRRKASLKLLRTESEDSEEFAASVERDLSQLPTIDDDRPSRR